MDTSDALSAARPSDACLLALARDQFGCALLDESQCVTRRDGALSAWLPDEGAQACLSPLLLNMEDSLEALKWRNGNIVLPAMRLSEGGRVTITIAWDGAAKQYLVVTTPDHASEQVERLLARERREKQILQQQIAAAAAETRTAEQRYIDVVESSGVLVFRYAPDFRIAFINGEAARFLGKPKNALIGERMGDLFPTTELTPWRVEYAGERPTAWEMQVPDPKGEAKWLAFETRFLGPEAGGETQAVARDVTPARRLRVERQK
ncbi:MAG: PAS domain-containing protein, partial [Methylocystis sp.]|nr:PAS domain-containing protein [Methylocystis sp.]